MSKQNIHSPTRTCTRPASPSLTVRSQRRQLLYARASEKPEETESSSPKLFSNLDSELKHEPGNLVGAISLVAGTTVGAGVLALPAEAQNSGFIPSSSAIVAAWLYMSATGLMLAEVNLNTVCDLGGGSVSLVSMAERTLGRFGASFVGGVYAFQHYCLLVAYAARGGEVLTRNLNIQGRYGPIALDLALGLLIYLTSSRQLDRANSALVLGVISTFVILVTLTLGESGGSEFIVDLSKMEWSQVIPSVPVIALAFVYQNVVPVIASSLEGDTQRIRKAILIGTGIPCAMFLVWDLALLSRIPPESQGKIADPLIDLIQTSPSLGKLADAFQLLAISTSFIGFVLGLSDFIADALKLPTSKREVPFLLTILPPTLFAVFFPDVFNSALKVAGVFGVSTLFGLVPPLMVYSERYGRADELVTQSYNKADTAERDNDATVGTPTIVQLVPGGRVALVMTIAVAAGVIGQDVFERIAG